MTRGYRQVYLMRNVLLHLGQGPERSFTIESELARTQDTQDDDAHDVTSDRSLLRVAVTGVSLAQDASWIDDVCSWKDRPPAVGSLLGCNEQASHG